MNIITIDLPDGDTEEQFQEIAWGMFCSAHPLEAYEKDPDKFWLFFHKIKPKVSRQRLVKFIKYLKRCSP